MNESPRYVFLFTWIMILAAFAYAQQPPTGATKAPAKPEVQKVAEAKAAPNPAPSKDAAAELTPQQLRALSLTREAGAEAFGIEAKRESAWLQARAADLLWPQDREGARKFFDQAFDTATDYYRESGDNNQQRVGRQAAVYRSDVRLEIIKLVNQHDKGLGEAYLSRFTEDKRKQAEERRKKNSEPNGMDKLFGENTQAANDLVRIASELLPVDPATAQRLALQSLNQGVAMGYAEFLARLAAKDRAAADKLFVAALTALQRAPQPMPGNVLALSAYPFGEGMVRIISGNNNWGYGFGKPENFKLEPQQIQQYLQAAYALLVRATPATIVQHPDAAQIIGAAFFTTKVLAPKVAEFAPALLEEWNGLQGRLQSLADDSSRQNIERELQNDAERRNGAKGGQQDSLKAALEQAEKAKDPNERDALFAEAAFEALEQDDFAQALFIASRIVDVDLRRRTKSWVNYQSSEDAREKKQWDDARLYALGVNETDQRAYLLMVIAQALLKADDRPRAIEMLQTAQREAENAEDTAGKVRALIGIANTFAGFDALRGFEVFEIAVKAANQLKEPRTFDKDDARVVRSFESKFGSRTQASTAPDFDLGRSLVTLARHDFERALNAAQALNHKPAQVAAILTLTESVLKKS